MIVDVRKWSVALIVSLGLTGPALCGPYEDAIAGYEAEQQGNYAEALRLYSQAAEQGNDYAQYSLASLYLTGSGVEQDSAKAVEWFLKSSEQGNVDSQFNLARILDSGSGIAENNTEAAKWYVGPAEQGNVDAQVNLAFLHFTGSGVPKNNAEAVKWFAMAAEQGHAGAQYNLGLVLVSDNAFVQAHKWLSLAEENQADTSSRDQAAAAKTDLEARMTPAQIAQAKK
jgi:TPR repeat protein